MSILRKSVSVVGVTSLCVVGLGAPAMATSVSGVSDVDSCTSFGLPVYQGVNPRSTASVLTKNPAEVVSAAKYGFTQNDGQVFKVNSGGLPIYRYYNNKSRDFAWGVNNEKSLLSSGYVNQKLEFYAASSPGKGCVGVHQVSKGDHLRFVTDVASVPGWRDDGIKFYAAPVNAVVPPVTPPPVTPPPVTPPPGVSPGDGDGVFSFAVIPDTQNEIFKDSDKRGEIRTQWLVDNKAEKDLRYVLHTGDIANWDTPSHDQYVRASDDVKGLRGVLPFAPVIGNHDAAATCQGGAACPGINIPQALRNTSTFNSYFPLSSMSNVGGVFEQGKVDNNYQVFSAEGSQWLVLSLELWPRSEVVDWADKVVAGNQDKNIIVQTHSYLNSDGSISNSNGGYGNTSPRYLYDNIIKQYPNIKMVFSGHTGAAASREDIGLNGNKITSYLGTFHSPKGNPVRVVTVDTNTGVVKSKFTSPIDNANMSNYDVTTKGMSFVK